MMPTAAFADAIRELPELADLRDVIERFGDRAETHVLATVRHDGVEFPIIGVVVGATRPSAPTLALVGGVHGLERIGTRVVLAGMHTIATFLTWDRMLNAALADLRVVFLPLLNPVGMWMRRRCNGSGVDLMRNAPPHPDASATPLVGGQRVSNKLPWYQGDEGAPMQLESRVLCDFIREWVFPARQSIVLDVHSGFGTVDRIWFPYAYTRRPFPSLAEVYALKRLLDETLPNHVYAMEPISSSYLVQGDLWDHLYDEHGDGRSPDTRHRTLDQAHRLPREPRYRGPFLPLTLELGSWLWVKKNPRQLFDVLGGFNPIRPHRLRRTLRRHIPLIEFLLRAVAGAEIWSVFDGHERQRMESEAFSLWFT
ncbi:DUF2817 domain-containing protein [Enhygromyxa salina]|uniref:Zinc carboxypeptidase n=1 Tax=Enhygromyxa salina TaxID=215803 RepID=A0A2S9YUX6_9BACT|nr:DUF2817 domain-containing protein [Enhygromyxa salina]PRQ08842.1 Zinc carboxypeptidase [Enhygromyxa salina]